MTTLFEEVEQFFRTEGISYEQKGLFFLCSLDGRQFYYSPNTGKWRIKGKRIWLKSVTPFDFVVQARQYSPPNYQQQYKSSKKSQSRSDQRKQQKRQSQSRDYSRNYYNYQQNNYQTYSNKKTNRPHELRSEFIEIFEQCLIQQRIRGYKLGWIWLTLIKQIIPTALEICWLSVVFGYSVGWAYYQIKEFYGEFDYDLLANAIKENQQRWLNYFLRTWGTHHNHQQQRQQHQRQKQHNKQPFAYQNYLDALKLTYPVTLSELKTAYRQRAKETHPDLGGTAEAFRQVNTAYEVLVTVI